MTLGTSNSHAATQPPGSMSHCDDAVAVLMVILHQASPTELIATAGFSRRPHGYAFAAMKDLVDTAQAGGADFTTQLLTSGFIDTLMSALSAVEEVGADFVSAHVVVTGALGIPAMLDGEALPQIEDKLRAMPSALRYAKASKIVTMADFGLTAGTFATLVAGELYVLCALRCGLAGSNPCDGCSQSLGEGRG